MSTAEPLHEIYPGSADYVQGPYGLGQRVPMLVVSPWSKGGWACSQVFDHTSIIRFMERRFGVHEPNISPWRRAICGDLTSAFDFARPNARPSPLPDTSTYAPRDRDRHDDYVPTPPDEPAMPRQEPGLRHARPLPYEPRVAGKAGAGKFTLDFATGNATGICYRVTSASQPGGPWSYTVHDRKNVSETWRVSGAYEFTVFGPNGFLRTFAGTGSGPEVNVRHHGGALQLILVNHGKSTSRLTVTDGYRGRSSTYTVRPGGKAVHTVGLERTNSWYDLTVVSASDESFIRRLAGHVENGRPSTTDPAVNRAPSSALGGRDVRRPGSAVPAR